jgi:hypothetical protein
MMAVDLAAIFGAVVEGCAPWGYPWIDRVEVSNLDIGINLKAWGYAGLIRMRAGLFFALADYADDDPEDMRQAIADRVADVFATLATGAEGVRRISAAEAKATEGGE